MKRDLAWGESVCVRQAFLETQGMRGMPVIFGAEALGSLGYTKHEGDPELVALTKKIIRRQIGRSYDHILISNGATGGVTIALRTFGALGIKRCVTNGPPYFRLYPDMIKAAGLTETREDHKDTVVLVDSPSNPLGVFSTIQRSGKPIIWDHTYFNRVYCPGKHPQPDHDVLVGSYGKLTGLNGLRVGWIATNNGLLYERMRILLAAEYCGISAASTKIILDTAGQFDAEQWSRFESSASRYLDSNREEWSRLEKYFSDTPVPSVGMFHYAPIDGHCKKLLNRSNIIWSPGSSLGTTDDFGRFNIGQDVRLVRDAVRAVLKNDRIR